MTPTATGKNHRYDRWDGQLTTGRFTWFTIVVTGIRLAMKERKTRTLMTTALGLVLGTCSVLYVLSLGEVLFGTEEGQGILEFVRGFLHIDLRGVSTLGDLREILWRTLFLMAIAIEMFWVLFVVNRVGPGLIANDLKHRALPIYFAKPVTPLTYVAGKWLIMAAFIALVTLVPNVASLILGVLITGGLQTWSQTLNLGWDLVVSGVVICVFGSSTILALSSMSSDSRIVTVGWLAVILIPIVGQSILHKSLAAESTTGWLGCLSPRDNVLTVTEWLFGLRKALEASGLPTSSFADALLKPVNPLYAATVLGAWSAGAMLITYRRVVKFSRTAANV